MEFKPRFVINVMSVFSIGELGNPNHLEMNLSLDSNNVFRRSLVIEVNNGEVEVPVIARVHFEAMVSYNRRIKRVILPLYDNTPSQERRTFDSIISQLFTNVGYGKRLQKITTNKGEVYYGGKGIIFDESYTPLLLCTLIARSVRTEDNGNIILLILIIAGWAILSETSSSKCSLAITGISTSSLFTSMTRLLLNTLLLSRDRFISSWSGLPYSMLLKTLITLRSNLGVNSIILQF